MVAACLAYLLLHQNDAVGLRCSKHVERGLPIVSPVIHVWDNVVVNIDEWHGVMDLV